MECQLLGYTFVFEDLRIIAFARKLNKLVELDCRQREIGFLDGALNEISRLDAATLVPEGFRASRHYQRASTSSVCHLIYDCAHLAAFIYFRRLAPAPVTNLMRD